MTGLPAVPAVRVLALFLLELIVAAPPTGAASSRVTRAASLNPPLVVLDEAYATCPPIPGPSVLSDPCKAQLSDSLVLIHPGIPPRDTVPSRSVIHFRWHWEPTAGGTHAAAFQYKLDEPTFVTVDTSVTSVTYNTGIAGDVIAPGVKVFFLRVVDEDGDSREINRYFAMNYAPDSWFAGPDTTLVPKADPANPFSERVVTVADWSTLAPQPGSLLSCDSMTVRPALRAIRRSFFELYQNHLYVHSEGDTVRMNSWVLLHGGGRDVDSPYLVLVSPLDPALGDTIYCPPADVLRPDGLVGSPIGFRWRYGETLTPSGMFVAPSASTVFPNFDPGSPFRMPVIGGYLVMRQAGKVYAMLPAVDGDGATDSRIPSAAFARNLADLVDAGGGTPEQVMLRARILTFYVDKAPVLLTSAPAFVPTPNQAFTGRTLALNLLATDEDPFDPGVLPPPGGPSAGLVLRRNVTLRGLGVGGTPLSYTPPGQPFFTPTLLATVPDEFIDPHLTVEVQLCDCALCDDLPGSGRCVTYQIPITVPADTLPTPTLASAIAAEASSDRVLLRWRVEGDGAARVERRAENSGWQDLGDALWSGSREMSFEDRTVVAATRYAYRLRLIAPGGAAATAGEVWVEVPGGSLLSLQGVRPNPSPGRDLTVSFTLPTSEPARLELLDLSGRVVLRREVGALGGGAHVVELRRESRLAPGVYMLRLTQGGASRAARVAVLQ